MRDFFELLGAKEAEGKSISIGLDSELDKIPKSAYRLWELHDKEKVVGGALTAFNMAIIEATEDLVSCYSLDLSYYLAHGVPGMAALRRTIMLINDIAPDVPVVLDAKATDVDNTNLGYIQLAFEYCKADAITVNPYLGREAAQPFLDQKNKGVIILCHTGNTGASEFQDLYTLTIDPNEKHAVEMSASDWLSAISRDSLRLYERVAHDVATTWNTNGNCALMVGEEWAALICVRRLVGDMPLFVPYTGKESDLTGVIKAGRNSNGKGLVINSAHETIFPSDGPDFALAARVKTMALTRLVNQCR